MNPKVFKMTKINFTEREDKELIQVTSEHNY